MLAPSEFRREQRGNATIWVSRWCADPAFIALLAGADRLFGDPECVVIKDQIKTKVARTVLCIAGERRRVYVKRYNAFSLRFKLLSVFCQSGAVKSLNGAVVLNNSGITTPRPLAAVETRFCGMLADSFLISEEITGGRTTDAYWIRSLRERPGADGFRHRRAFLSRLARLFQSLHAQRIYHNDLKDANILAVGDGMQESIEYFLLDLEGVKRCFRLSRRRRVKNLVQLYRTLGKHVSRPRKLFFLKCYLGPSYGNKKTTTKLIQDIMRRAGSEDLRKGRKRPDQVSP